MTAISIAKSIRTLKAVLNGQTYDAVAKTSNMTRSAVEQRVKGLARELHAIVGVEGIDEDETPTVLTMRSNKVSYLDALRHYQPERAERMRARNCMVTEQELDLAIKKIRQIGNCGNRDIVLSLVLFSTAAKPLEIGRLEVRDYLRMNQSVKSRRCGPKLRSAARPGQALILRKHKSQCRYRRIPAKAGATQARRAGIKQVPSDPISRLFLTDEGNGMPIKIKERGNRRHHLCGVIQNICRKIFVRTGLRGVTALSAEKSGNCWLRIKTA